MTPELQVASNTSLRVALESIGAAIYDAWTDTRVQMHEREYHPAVVHTAFGQFLAHNVLNRVFQIETTGMVSQFVPNRRGSAYHVKVVIEGRLFLTISAVENSESPPRPARFRNDYAEGLQSWFEVTAQDEFELVVPTESEAEYIQILHGPDGLRGQKRQELGFIYVAFPLSGGGNRRPSMPLDAYIAELSLEGPAEIEYIREEGGLGVTLKKEALNADE